MLTWDEIPVPISFYDPMTSDFIFGDDKTDELRDHYDYESTEDRAQYWQSPDLKGDLQSGGHRKKESGRKPALQEARAQLTAIARSLKSRANWNRLPEQLDAVMATLQQAEEELGYPDQVMQAREFILSARSALQREDRPDKQKLLADISDARQALFMVQSAVRRFIAEEEPAAWFA